MKFTGIVLLSFLLLSFTTWETNFEKAKTTATKEHKYILLNFSGSDWCGPCIRMHKEIFDNEAFQQFATQKLVMMNADFPRQKKNQLSKDLQKQNDQLADKYNSKGSFPMTALLDANGNLLRSWEGLPKESADQFLNELKDLTQSNQ
ncbi:MAG: thioredoxin family protein [Bacteroidetes bacterium]|nr:thioredoxin family protein [Bacteroidota bacterium]